jgi:hypothetical protein
VLQFGAIARIVQTLFNQEDQAIARQWLAEQSKKDIFPVFFRSAVCTSVF